MSSHIVAMAVPRGVVVVRVTCWVMDVNEFGQDLSDDSPVVAASEPFEVFFRHEYRSVLGLAFVLCGVFYAEGFTRSETGQLLGISEESVKTHLDRARQRLGRELDDHAHG